MLNVLYSSNAYTTHDYRFLKAFVSAGWAVDWLPLSGVRLDERPVPDGVRVLDSFQKNETIPDPSDCLQRVPIVREILQNRNPHVVVAGPIQTATWLMARAGANPLIAMSWGSDLLVEAHANSEREAITRFALERSVGLLGDCEAVHCAANAFTPFSDEQVLLLPWGLDDPASLTGRGQRMQLRKELGWEDCLILLSVRSWEPVYDIETLISAFAQAHRSFPNLRLLLLGDGSRASQIRARIEEEGVADYIRMPGRIAQHNLSDYYQCADLYVSSALSDGTSVSLLEAMAHQLPVIGAGVYGNLEWIEPGKGGWLFDPGDVQSLAHALREALSNTSSFRVMGSWNRQVVLERANWQENVQGLLDFLVRVADESGDVRATS